MSRSTGAMAVIVLAAFYLLLQDMRREAVPESGSSRYIYEIDAELITEVTVLKNGTMHISASKLNDDWFITQPIKAKASG